MTGGTQQETRFYLSNINAKNLIPQKPALQPLKNQLNTHTLHQKSANTHHNKTALSINN